MVKKIKITGMEDIMKLNKVATAFPYDISLQSENAICDAKSPLGMYALKPGSDLKLVVPDDVDAGKLFNELNDLIA